MSIEEDRSKNKKIEIVEEDLKELIQQKPEILQQIFNDLQSDPQFSIALKQTKIHSGPLPSPETLKEYNKSYKNAAQDIVNMAKNEQSFRHKSTYLGQFSALLIGLGGLAVTAYLGVNSQPVLAGLIGFGSLGSLVGTFLYNKKQPVNPSQLNKS